MDSQFPIFINYRRSPDEPAADQLYDLLAASFPGHVFLDKEGIGPGEETCGNTIAGKWAGAALNLINARPLLAAWIREHLGVEFHRCTPEEQADLLPLLLRARELP